MALYSSTSRRPAPIAAFTLFWAGKPRTFTIGRIAAIVGLGLLPIIAALYLAVTAYIIFHDQLVGSLISRQADIQYSYEDRIAVLKTQLDQQTSRALVDQQTLSTTIRDLSDRSHQLEARAGTIENLVRTLSGSHAKPSVGSSDASLVAPAARQDLGATGTQDGGDGTNDDGASIGLSGSVRNGELNALPENHSELSPDAAGAHLSRVFARIEQDQAEQVARLRGPMLRSVAKLRTALEEAGLHFRATDPSRGEGGPFVPLPDGVAAGLDFDQNVALLREAVALQMRLTSLVDKVPLRRPLEGQLEVTSPFGARLDPFFGRAAMHTGVDLMQPYGGPVFATGSGTVTVAGPEGGYGNMVEIDHGGGLVTRYAHLSAVSVSVHEKVGPGTIVGHVGSTGRATGPHLHYETRINGEPVDPERFLKAGAGLFRG